MNMSEQDRQRFWAKVDASDENGCWEWQGGCNSHGYGVFGLKGKSYGSHRISWELHYFEIPKGKCVCHHCDNPSCVNPDHLFLGTQQDNLKDMRDKGRQARGVDHGNSKLTPEIVKEIRRRHKPHSRNHGTRALAREFGITPGAIGHVINRERWDHV